MNIERRTVVRMALISEGQRTGTICVGKRAEGLSNEGEWCIVGGKAEKGKNNKREALRETVEETGLDLETLLQDGEPLLAHTVVRKVGNVIWKTKYYFMDFDPALILDLLDNFNREEFSDIKFMEEEKDMEGMTFAYSNDVAFLVWFFRYVGN